MIDKTTMNEGWTQTDSPFHPGEQEVQTRMGVRDKIENIGRKVIRAYLPEQHREFYTLLPFLVVGMTDKQGRPWVSLLTGIPGFITSPDPHHLHIATKPLHGSPIGDRFQVGSDIGILGILPKNRRRNRSTGRIIAIDDDGMTIEISQTFGNCPQYIQTREMEMLPEIAFNTIGNIVANPKVGFLFIDFETRDLLYLTGSAEIIWSGDEVKNLSPCGLALCWSRYYADDCDR